MANLGFAVEEVHGDDPANCYAYTVGLALYEDPELVVFGLPTEAALPLLTAAALAAVGQAESAESGTDEIDGLLHRFPVAVHELPAAAEYLTVAHAMWEEWSPVGEKPPFRAVRLVLDDEWEPDMGHGAAAWDLSVMPPPLGAGG